MYDFFIKKFFIKKLKFTMPKRFTCIQVYKNKSLNKRNNAKAF